MNATSAPVTPCDPRRQLAELRFCLAELDDRCASAAAPAWLWEMKRRVARYCLRRLEDQGEVAITNLGELDATDERQLLQSHPLLRNRLNESPLGVPNRQWMNAVRDKVRSYVRSARENSEIVREFSQDPTSTGEPSPTADLTDFRPPE